MAAANKKPQETTMSEPKELLVPPNELIAEWIHEWDLNTHKYMYAKCAQWGADQELNACCDWLEDNYCDDPQDNSIELRKARRSRPPSLKQQALEALNQADNRLSESEWQQRSEIIRRAVEALPNE